MIFFLAVWLTTIFGEVIWVTSTHFDLESTGINQPSPHHTVCILGEPLQREQRVVRLNNYVAHLVLVREHRVRLYQFLWVPVERETFCWHTLDHHTLSEQAKSLFVDLSLSFSSRYDPSPEPVPPAIEWHKTNPYEDTRVTYNSACATCVRSSQQLHWCTGEKCVGE